MKIRAVLVGIEEYTGGIPPAPGGPCRNAIEIADWFNAGPMETQIHLFLSGDKKPQAGFQAEVKDASFASLNQFLRVDLRRKLKRDELLFFYWSGHGITVPGGDRVLLYQDYADALPNYALSLNEWRETLSDATMFQSREQLFLIDACANRVPDICPQPLVARPGKFAKSERYEVYAAQEGDYAINRDRSGVFSREVMNFLSEAGTIQSARNFYQSFRKYLEGQTQRFFVAELGTPEGKAGLDATTGEDTGSTLADLLRKLPLPLEVLHRHYHRTIEKLKMPQLWNAASLSGMVEELVNLKKSPENRFVPEPLVEFAMRVSREAKDSAPFTLWINDNSEPATRAEIESEIESEDFERHLIIGFADDPMKRGQLAAIESLLYPSDFSKPIADFRRRPVSNWDQVAGVVRSVVEEANQMGSGRLSLHFLVSTPMLAYAPHELQDLDLIPFGAQFPAFLRSRDRFYNPHSQIAERWKRRATSIKGVQPVGVYPLPGQAGKLLVDALNASTGVYYLSECVACQRDAVHGVLPVMRALKELIDQGAPFFCFLHTLPADPNCWAELADRLQKWLDGGLQALPAKLCDERASYDPYAMGVSIVWDDPVHLPRQASRLNEVKAG